jgi:hypothetical protein
VEEELTPAVQVDRWDFQVENAFFGEVQDVKLDEQGNWTFRTSHVTNLKGRTLGRLQTFTELRYTWSVETDSKKKLRMLYLPLTGDVLSVITTNDGSIHALISDPFQIHTYLAPDHYRYISLNLVQFMPLFSSDYLATRANKNKPFLAPLAGNKFSIIVPIYNLLIVVDMENKTMAPYHIPGIETFRQVFVFES